jgi:oligoendopeptidase F
MSQIVQPRSAIRLEDTWNVTSVFPTDESWDAEIDAVGLVLDGLPNYQGRLGSSPAVLAEWLDLAFRLENRVSRVYLYASMLHDIDTAAPGATARRDKAVALYSRALSTMAFAEPEILQIGFDRLHSWQDEHPDLTIYAHYFEELEERQAHIRSAEVEELLGMVNEPFSSATRVHGTLADADLRFQPAKTGSGTEVDVAQGNLSALLTSADRELRRTAWEHYADAFLAHKNTLAGVLATGVKQHVFIARARHYGSSLESALAPHRIPVEVFHNLVNTFRQHLPTWHRYWALRRRVLGYDSLHVYDIKAPLADTMPHVSFAQAVEWVSAGMAPLGDEYVEVMRRGLTEQRWVDIYPNQGKRSGAYSHGVAGTYPFILMSFNDDIFGLSTLAHELGHAMHSYYAWQHQPLVYSSYSLFVAEVASNFNQALVRGHLLQQTGDRAFQIAVIEEAMSNFHRYFFIMPTLARFELEIHERVERGEPLTADSMIALMNTLFAEGYGTEVVNDAERIGITWAQFPSHLYSPFYVYQYATGISAAHALAKEVLGGSASAADNYRRFLKAGGSLYPLDALKLAGVDMLSTEPVESTFAVLDDMVARLEQLLDGTEAV